MTDHHPQKILKPSIHPSVFIAEGARIYGDVEIREGASVWFNAVIRGDEGRIVIGRNTNIQDNCVVHSDQEVGIEIGDEVTIGHGAIIRGCRIGNGCMIGMNATIMNNSEIGAESIVGTGAVVPYNKTYPPRSLILGVPARPVRVLADEETTVNRKAARIYQELVDQYRSGVIAGYEPPTSSNELQGGDGTRR
jgi:carbonic anhydrase/acetyltransferase-like protein (isoleucine patch superfamily)